MVSYENAHILNESGQWPFKVTSSKVVYLDTNRKRVCDFLLIINSNLGVFLPSFRDIAGFLLTIATPCKLPNSYSTRILGLFPLDYIADADVGAPRSEDPKL